MIASSLSCLALVVSTIGPGDLNVPTRELPSVTASAYAAAPAGLLPARVDFRTPTESFNRKIDVAVRNGRLYFRPRGGGDVWRNYPLPGCIEGRLRELSLDDDELLAIDADRNVLTMDNALSDPLLWNWTSRWGALTWTGPGRTLPAAPRAWSWSVISQPEDGNWTDTAGNRTQIGQGKVSHVFMIARDGLHIPWIDPWLPIDDSYQVCGPLRGRFRMANLSASGSTIFVIGRHGDMFTRLYDFDLSGSDTLFFQYSYDDQRGARSPKIQLPVGPWVRQPRVPGEVTSVISVEKRGRDALHRTLRVQGVARGGYTGYWEKDSADLRASAWTFHRTDVPLKTALLDRSRPGTNGRALGRNDDARYASSDGMLALTNFNPFCSPARLRVALPGEKPFDLKLHTVDSLRQTPRGPGLDSNPREYYGAVEVPPAVRDSATPAVKSWLAARFPAHFTSLQVMATRGAIAVPSLGWTLAG